MFFNPKEHEPSHIHALYGEHILNVVFDDGRIVMYDMKEDMEQLPGYSDLKNKRFV